MVSGFLGGIAGGATVAITIKAIDQYSGTFKKAESAMGKFNVAGKAMVSTGKLVTGALTAVGIATTALGVSSIKAAADFEQTGVAFETMLGSAEAAEKLLADLADFAKRTPFTLTGIETSAKQMMAMGVSADDLLPTLKSMGDVAAGLAVPLDRIAYNFGQVQAQGKLTGVELRDFARAGVPVIETLTQMAEAGQLNERAMQYLSGGVIDNTDAIAKLEPKLQIAQLRLQELSEKENVAASTMLAAQEKVRILTSEYDALVASNGQVTESTEISTAALQDMVSKGLIAADDVALAFQVMTSEGGKFEDLMSKQAETVAGKFSNLQDTFELIQRDIGGMVIPVVAELADLLLNEVVPAVEPLIPIIGEALSGALSGLIPIIPQLVEFLSKLIDVSFKFFGALEPLADPLMKIAFVIADSLIGIIEQLTPVIMEVAKVFAEDVMPAIEPLIPIIGEIFVDAITTLLPYVPELTEYFVRFVEISLRLLDALLPLIDPLMEITFMLLDPLLVLMEALIPVFESFVPLVEMLAIALEPVVWVLEKVVDLFSWLIGMDNPFSFVSGVSKVADFFGIDTSSSKSKPKSSKKKEDFDNVQSLNDFILTPEGKVLQPHPNDTIIGTKTPGAMGGINIQIGTVQGLDPDSVAEALERKLSSMIRV